MEKEAAKNIMNQCNLIPGKISRKILFAIENNMPLATIGELPECITYDALEKINTLYQKKAKSLNYPQSPRNIVFYHLIKDKVPSFSWGEHFGIKSPKIKKLRPSLLSLLLNKITADSTVLDEKYQCIEILPRNILSIIANLMEKLEVIYPNEQSMKQIVAWIQKGLNKEPLTIFSPLCPDYSIEPTNNPKCPYRHTFNELGSGLGLIAQRILSAIPELKSAFAACGLQVKIIIGFGDFEAYSSANLQRLKITQEEFLIRLTKSKKLFENAVDASISVNMITDMLGGYENWLKKYQEFISFFEKYDFGVSGLTYKKLLDIVGKRKNLYDRWYGEKPHNEHIPQLLAQGAEYSVLGDNLIQTLENCLVLGADNDAMGPFYSVTSNLPALYLKRFYC